MTADNWAFAFATVSYLLILGMSYRYLFDIRHFLGKLFRPMLQIQAGITVWMAVASSTAFNGAIQEIPVNPDAILFRYLILLVVPLLISAGLVYVWRYIGKEKKRLRQ